jgi:hypothetical protein
MPAAWTDEWGRIAADPGAEMSAKTKKMMSWAAALAMVGGGLFPGAAHAEAVRSVSVADADLAHDLQFSREEERMARDLFAVLAERYDGANPFANVTLSEEKHFAAIGDLLVRYDVVDPSDGLPPGTYADTTVQSLYDLWLEQGMASLDAAYEVGVALEKQDIHDLEAVLEDAAERDVIRVYTNLLEASHDHLDAYEQAAEG